MGLIEDISVALQNGKAKEVKRLVPLAIEEGISADDILQKGLMAGMNIIGGKFKNNEVFVPEVLVAARAMNAGAALLKPYLQDSENRYLGKVIIGTVKGDLHDIGKNLVKMMYEGKGFEVVDLGVDVGPETFVKAIQDEKCQIVACSALLTTTMPVMKEVIDAITAAGLRDQVKIMVGGAPVTQEFSDSIGADAYTDDAASAAIKAVELIA